MLTLTFRYFFGSFLIASMSARASLAAPFMFSYNSLLCSNCCRVPSDFWMSDDERVDPRGHRVEPVVELLLGQELAHRVVVRCEAPGHVFEVRRRRGQRLRQRIVLEEPAEAALAGVDPPGHLLQIRERRVERARTPPAP